MCNCLFLDDCGIDGRIFGIRSGYRGKGYGSILCNQSAIGIHPTDKRASLGESDWRRYRNLTIFHRSSFLSFTNYPNNFIEYLFCFIYNGKGTNCYCYSDWIKRFTGIYIGYYNSEFVFANAEFFKASGRDSEFMSEERILLVIIYIDETFFGGFILLLRCKQLKFVSGVPNHGYFNIRSAKIENIIGNTCRRSDFLRFFDRSLLGLRNCG